MKKVLDICHDLAITPVLNGSLAVFVYTGNQAMSVNDVDLSCSEAEFPKVMGVLEERGISYRLKEWYVLQILKDDLKIELDSMEYWYKDFAIDYETLQIDDYQVKMFGLKSLRECYRRGMKDSAEKTDENERRKYAALKEKYETLEKVKG